MFYKMILLLPNEKQKTTNDEDGKNRNNNKTNISDSMNPLRRSIDKKVTSEHHRKKQKKNTHTFLFETSIRLRLLAISLKV